ncbi:MAG: dihydrodipicolinate synthase family protein [Gemmataceae bacterium]
MPYTGLIAAPHTPLRPNGDLNLGQIPRQVDHLASRGVKGVFVCGTTGEGLSLMTAERQAVAEAWVTAAAGRMPVIVHAGHASQREAAALAAHAEKVGAAGVACVAPFYHTAPGVPELVGFLADVAAAAPRTPFYFYDIPSTTHVRVQTAAVMRQAAERIATFAGVKYSHPDLVTLQQCVAVREGVLEVLFGVDEMFLAAYALGVRGGVGSTYNFAAPLYHRMLAAADAGDWPAARLLQRQSVELVRVIEEFGGLAANKAVMRLVGVDCGPVRSPLAPLTADQEVRLGRRLAELGLFTDDVSGSRDAG